MKDIKRLEIDEFWADSTIIEAGDYVFVGYCMGNEDGSIEEQINGAFETLKSRLALAGLNLDSVVKMDCLFRNISDLNFLPDIIKKYFNEKNIYRFGGDEFVVVLKGDEYKNRREILKRFPPWLQTLPTTRVCRRCALRTSGSPKHDLRP